MKFTQRSIPYPSYTTHPQYKGSRSDQDYYVVQLHKVSQGFLG